MIFFIISKLISKEKGRIDCIWFWLKRERMLWRVYEGMNLYDLRVYYYFLEYY